MFELQGRDLVRGLRCTFRRWDLPIFIPMVILGLAFCGSPTPAQSGAGSIQGTVTDATGAVLPGASVQIVNTATNVAANAKANGVGFYQVPGLFTGTYRVTITAAGMKTYSQTIELLVGQTAVINAKMSPGAVTQKITVSGNAVQLTNTTSGTISSTLEAQRINQLPMNTRNLLTLAADTVPGLEGGDRDNGLMPEATEYVADGVSLNNDNFGGQNNTFQSMLPDADSVQEMSFDMSNTPAQYATPGTVVLTTKSGTNALHGSLFETAVNSYWGESKTRNDQSSFAAPPYIRNEFGASAGGPIVIPGLYHGKDKSFWFFAYERYSLASTSEEQVSVPTLAERNGDFSGMSSGGVLQAIYDPSTTAQNPNCPLPPSVQAGSVPASDLNNYWCRTQFAYQGVPNTIDPARESQGAKLMYSITPQPTNSNNPLVQPNLNSPDVNFNVIPTMTWRLDQSFNASNKAFLRFQQNLAYSRALRNYPHNEAATIAANGFPAGASGYQLIPEANFAAALGYTHIFSPTFFAETNLSQQWFMQYVGGGGNPKLDYDKMLGLANNFGETGFPVISGLSTMNYGGTMYQYQENQIVSQIDENLTKIVGKHQLEFGGRIRHDRFYYLNSRNADTTSFTSYTTALELPSTGANPSSKGSFGSWPNTGVGDAGLFLGNVASSSVQLQDPPTWFRDMEFDGYFQDNWHARRNFTLNLGFRYEAHPARQTRDNVMDAYDLANHAIVLGAPISNLISEGWTTQAIITNMNNIGAKFESAQQAGYPSALYKGSLLTVSPRVGFAWQPFGAKPGTVLRGGYGRYIYPIPTRNENPGPTSLPFSYGYTQDYNSANQSPDGLPNYTLREVYDPANNSDSIEMGVNSSNIVNTSTTTAIVPGFGGQFFDPDYKPDMVTEVNATIEQPLKWNSALRVSWVWTHGSYLDHFFHPNSPLSAFVWEMNTGTTPPIGGPSVIGTSQQDTYKATALGPYDNTVYGDFIWNDKTGYSNDNNLQINYQRLFHNGFAFQIFYVWSKAFRLGGNTFRDGQVYTPQDYLGVQPITASFTSSYPVTQAAIPPSRPAGAASYADWHGIDVWQRYQLDAGIPPQHLEFNYIFDLPVGRGKRFLSNANQFVNELIGGYQIAGVGSPLISEIFQPNGGYWGPIHPIHVYKHNLKIRDCRSGNCYPAYLWFNGYIPPTQNANSGQCTAANGVKTGAGGALECVYGLPADYTPYAQPIDTVPGTPFYNTNNVTVNLANGKTDTQAYGSGPAGINPYSKTFIAGPKNWNTDISLFKVFPITERANLRFNMDVFNFLNHQGWKNPNGTDGIEAYYPGGSSGAQSYNPPRQMQFTLRLTF